LSQKEQLWWQFLLIFLGINSIFYNSDIYNYSKFTEKQKIVVGSNSSQGGALSVFLLRQLPPLPGGREKEERTTNVGLRTHVRNLEKYPDCRTALIVWEGGNIDVCPGRQTPSRRHCKAD